MKVALVIWECSPNSQDVTLSKVLDDSENWFLKSGKLLPRNMEKIIPRISEVSIPEFLYLMGLKDSRSGHAEEDIQHMRLTIQSHFMRNSRRKKEYAGDGPPTSARSSWVPPLSRQG